jgi:hypothetical protein
MASDRLGKIKLKQLNTRKVVFTKEHFRKLAVACSKALVGMSDYHPVNREPGDLRSHLNELYGFLRTHLSDIYSYDFDANLMYGATINNCDLVQGSVDVIVTYPYLGNQVRFCLQCFNDAAPYGQQWPEMMRKVGAEPGNYTQKLSMV